MRLLSILGIVMLPLMCVAQGSVSMVSGELPLKFERQYEDSLTSQAHQWRYAVVQMDRSLNKSQRLELESQKLYVISPVGSTYLVRYPANRSLFRLATMVRAAAELTPELKHTSGLSDKLADGTTMVQLRFDASVGPTEVLAMLSKQGFEVVDDRFMDIGILIGRLGLTGLHAACRLPWVFWVEQWNGQDEEIRYRSLGSIRARVAHAHGLKGNGVVVGVGDGGKVGDHLDLNTHIDQRASFGISGHATHVSGIVAGRGVLDPSKGTGVAPSVDIISSNYSNILAYADTYVTDDRMTLTNNSYGVANTNCTVFGDYNLISTFCDAQIRSRDTLLHVFAAGNSGGNTCGPYASGFATILPGYQTAKNVLTVGSVSKQDNLNGFSSKGPTDDGRLKPEIVAVGSSVNSTRPNNLYASGNGTSYSAPAITGASAIITQRYRQLHGVSPTASLLKSILCNTADDLGNPGPDFRYGFGRANLREAIRMVDNEWHFIDSLQHDDSQSVLIEIPEGLAQLRVMAVWTDPDAVPFVSPSLVNDIDLKVVDPEATIYEPWVLDPAPAKVNNNAIRGRDSLNNYEQVTIQNPSPGSYEIQLTGASIPMGPQTYALTYTFVYDTLAITNPVGGGVLKPGRAERIRWDAYGDGIGNFNVEYSYDSLSWSTISASVSPSQRYVEWVVPDSIIENLYFRVSNGVYSSANTSPNCITPIPSDLSVASPCASFAQISWSAVDGADHYRVYDLSGGEVELIDTTSTLSLVTAHLEQGLKYWYSVSAVSPGGCESYRASAMSVISSGNGQCPWGLEVRPKAILMPVDGRLHTTSELGVENVVVSLHNSGIDSLSGFEVSYILNQLDTVVEVVNDTIPPGESIVYSFAQPIDLSASGSYALKVYTSLPGDLNMANDTVATVVEHVMNDTVGLPMLLDFEGLPDTSYEASNFAIDGSTLMDYVELTGEGRIRTNAGSGIVLSGNRSLTIDAADYGFASENELTLTFNLSSFDPHLNDLRLDFDFMSHDLLGHNIMSDTLWLRGSDTSSWIAILGLAEIASRSGIVSAVRDLSISEFLRNSSQGFSTSVQLKFDQSGTASVDVPSSEQGYTIDNIRLYEVGIDLQLSELIQPQESCGVNPQDITILVRNPGMTSISKIVAYYVMNGQDTIENQIGTLSPFTDTLFTFDIAVDLSQEGIYDLDVWIESVNDTYSANDSIIDYKIRVLGSIMPDAIGYFESFESGDGGWYVSGEKTSMARGVPTGTLISEAADGLFAWVTNPAGPHNADEISYLNSPCFDLSGFVQPVLSFGHTFQIEEDYDYAWVEYTVDGEEWIKLGTVGEGFKWYNNTTEQAWDGVREDWRVASIEVPSEPMIRFRFVFDSDLGLEMEGFGVDAVHIHESTVIQSGLSTSTDTIFVTDGWNHIELPSGRIASVNVPSSGPSDYSIDYFFNSGELENDGAAYILNPSAVVNTTSDPDTSMTMRLYLKDSVIDSATTVDNCLGCITLSNPFKLEMIQYSGANEDSMLTNNALVGFRYFSPERILPFGDGYALEFRVDSFSEFWITSPRVPVSDSIFYRLQSGTDDAHEWVLVGAVDPYAGTLRAEDEFQIGLRFPDVRIPPGAYVEDAYLTLTSSADTTGSRLRIAGLSASTISAFTTGNYNISERITSEFYLDWELPFVVEGTSYNSPSIRAIIQEKIDQPQWKPGKGIGFTLWNSAPSLWYSLEGDSLLAATLYIKFDSVCTRAGRLYVDSSAVGDNNGSTWADAFNDLQQAIDVASHCAGITDIWVARGTYYPSLNNRSRSFNVTPGVSIYGGFIGNETSLDQRQISMNPVILSGDIGIAGDQVDNSYHVISNDSGVTAILDGLTVSNGVANGSATDDRSGAGVRSTGGIELRNCIIENCESLDPGSAIYHSGSGVDFILSNCTLRNNSGKSVRSDDDAELIIRGTNTINNGNE